MAADLWTALYIALLASDWTVRHPATAALLAGAK